MSALETLISPRSRDLGSGFKAEQVERGAYLTDGRLKLEDGTAIEPGTMPVFRAGVEVALRAEAPSRVLLFGGEPLDGPRHIVWNFVSSSAKRLAGAKEDWKAGRFSPVPSETEWIPLPDDLPSPVDYP